MPKQSQSKTNTDSETKRRSPKLDEKKLDLIDSWLQKMTVRFPEKQTLMPDEIQDWHRDLTPFTSMAIEFAFDAYRRNGLFFPHTGQILDVCISFEPPEQSTRSTSCRIDDPTLRPEDCKARHYKGYGWPDVLWVWKRMIGEVPFYFPNTNARLDRVLVDARALAGKHADTIVIARARAERVINLDALFNELDLERGRTPEWRQAG